MKNIAYILFSALLVLVVSCKEDDVVYNTAARAGFTAGGAEEYEVGESITFTDATVPEAGTKIVKYLWEFGDEAKSTSGEQSPTFIYKKDGTYLVKLTVTDDNNLEATSQKEVKVINPTSPDFTLDNSEYQIGDVVRFTDATTTKSGTTITAYLWEFGDADKSTSKEQNPAFTYTEAGAFAVKLTVTDSYGLTASITKNVTVFDPSKAIAVMWSAPLTGSVTGGSSPALSADGSVVYMLTGGSGDAPGWLNACNIADGSFKWKLDIDKAMQANHNGGSTKAGAKDIYGSPSVGSNGNVYFIVRDLKDGGKDRRLFVFAVKEDGNVNWAYPAPDANVYSITPAVDASGNIYVAQRGKKLWKLSSSGAFTELASAGMPDVTAGLSLAKDGTIYGFGKGGFGLFAYDTSADAGKWVYNTDFGGASSAFVGALRSGTVTVGADGTVYAVTDAATGGAIFALNPDGTEKWRYSTTSEIPDGGVVLGADGTVYATGGVKAGANSAGLIALNADGTLKWHYATEESVQTSPLIDNRGYIHFVSADAVYYILKPDGTLFSSMSVGDSSISSPVMDANGNLFVAVKKDGGVHMVCATSRAASYATDSAWPMRGQNPQRTGLQK